MPRQNTQLESEGAEFLVLGQLLIQGIPAYKTYTNMPGYGLVTTNPEKNRTAGLQVKSRWKTNAEGFIIKNFDCDVVIIVKLNRRSNDGHAEVFPPEFFVLPVSVAQDLRRTEDWGKVSFRNIPSFESYRDRWDFFRTFLDDNTCLSPTGL